MLEESTCNEERSGAVACIGLACDALAGSDPVVVVAGDTLPKPDFSLDRDHSNMKLADSDWYSKTGRCVEEGSFQGSRDCHYVTTYFLCAILVAFASQPPI